MDPRIARTRQLLQEALLDLARERDLDAISIADITDRATVNRSTFYKHYEDKETLLADALDAQAALAGAELSAPDVDITDETPPDLLVRYTQHVAENASLYRQVLCEGRSPATVIRLRARVREIVMEALRTKDRPDTHADIPADIVAASVTGSLVEVFAAWLAKDPLPPPEECAQWIWLLLAHP